MRPEDMPDASALWNLNRQLSFFAGALLLAQALSFMQDYLASRGRLARDVCFAAVITLLPVLYVYRLNNTQLLAQLQQEQP